MSRCRSRRVGGRRDDGFALPMALVTVVVIAMTFTAIAGFEDTTLRAQTVLADKADVDLAADSAIDAAISALEANTDAGQYQVGQSTVPGASQPCHEFDSAFTYPDETLGDAITVACFADPQSVSTFVTAGEPPDFVIRTIGGMEGTGDVDGGGNTQAPYCDDFQAAGGACEAGVFIGMGVNADPGGLVVVPNNPADLDPEPLLQSNSSIISRRGSTQRTLNVQGKVAARRACPDVQATGGTACNQPGTWWETPLWQHELWDDDSLHDIARPRATWDTYDPDGPGGFAGGNESCLDSFVIFEPGWYFEMAELNTWTSTCPAGTTFWFTPGTYYFDFVDAGSSPHYWDEPTNFAQFVGGTPQGWNPCAPCPQPVKRMRPEAVTASTAWSTPSGSWTIGDGSQTTLEFPVLGGPLRTITYRKPRTPLPVGNQVGTVVLRVSAQHDIDATLYETPPKVTVEIEGVTGASCTISLLANPTKQEFELPQDCTTRSASFPATPGEWSGRADWVNKLKATLAVRRSGTATPLVAVDGIEFSVTHSGAPAPEFPTGCERGKPGVQFVFGNLSRMKFKGNDAHVELCGSRGVNDEHALTVYGLTEETTPAALRHTSGAADLVTGDWESELLSSSLMLTAGGVAPSVGNGGGGPQVWESIGDGTRLWTDPAWNGAGAASLSFRLPSTFVPAGSTIEAVRCKLAHAEPRLNTWTPQGITSISVAVNKPLGSTLDPSDPDGDDSKNGICNFVVYEPPGESLPWSGLEFYAGPLRTDVSGDTALSPNLRTSNALNGATVTLTVNGNAVTKGAIIDGLEIEVDYRPPGTLRPLRGCLTTRLGDAPETANRDEFRGISPIHNGAPYVTPTDAAFRDDSGAIDVNACALVNVQSDSSGVGTKLHISGTVYAPTAALQFTGKDNNAPMVTDGVLARHISVLRFGQDGSGAGFGGGSGIGRGPRKVLLQVFHDDECVAEATVEFSDDDSDGRDEARIISWERRPGECQSA